jgi:hypothetical protein
VVLLQGESDFQDNQGVYRFSQGESPYLDVHMPEVTQAYYSAFESAPTPEQLLVYMYTDILGTTIDETGIEPRDDGVQYAL